MSPQLTGRTLEHFDLECTLAFLFMPFLFPTEDPQPHLSLHNRISEDRLGRQASR